MRNQKYDKIHGMQIPYRKPGKFSNIQADTVLTQSKFDELKKRLEHLKKVSRPRTSDEVARLAQLGDFSENFEYQNAKGRLRGINNQILVIENQLNHATIISPKNSDVIQVGNMVTVECNGKQKIFQILGSSETNPTKGIISYTSPIGSAIIGHKIGDLVDVKVAGKKIEYKIITIN
jgi:transcription elongation factor GreA